MRRSVSDLPVRSLPLRAISRSCFRAGLVRVGGLSVLLALVGGCLEGEYNEEYLASLGRTDSGNQDAAMQDGPFTWGLGGELDDFEAGAGSDLDAGVSTDANASQDASQDGAVDGQVLDATTVVDAAANDAGSGESDAEVDGGDAGTEADAGTGDLDAGAQDDAGSVDDAGTDDAGMDDAGAPPAQPPAGAVVCAAEGGVCQLPDGVSATVWYGIGEAWVVLTDLQGAVNCNNETFTDPAVGFGKECRYVQSGSI